VATASARSLPALMYSIEGGTPTEIIEKLNSEFDTALSDSKMKARLADLGSTVLPGSPADFGKLIAEDTEKGAKVVKFAGIKAD
jgi:tripartite-type tricarboxylate transporter receptor subunit TctC